MNEVRQSHRGSRRFRATLLCVVVLVAGLTSACGSSGTDLTIRITDRGLELSKGRMFSGSVRLKIDNATRDNRNLVFVAADSIYKLPKSDTGQLVLPDADVADRVEEFGPGLFLATVPSLGPGRYVVVSERLAEGLRGQARFEARQAQPLFVSQRVVRPKYL